ncbi:hypothetical protein FOL47_009163 [Perkinsus chesapeaki]|uniref:Peptidase A1 domain-containing protein n=1 Tax=Perkinsus chesapeaki TaxID=330153 RepID=A0A7J6MTD6_PERCH|nr:hypothetical protein FOL47_009163 [Perkinsus chesapeaki]
MHHLPILVICGLSYAAPVDDNMVTFFAGGSLRRSAALLGDPRATRRLADTSQYPAVFPLTYDFRTTIEMDGELVSGTIDTGSASVRRYIYNPQQTFGCVGDRCFKCEVDSCKSGKTFGNYDTYDQYRLELADSKAVISLGDRNRSDVYVQNIVRATRNDGRPTTRPPISVDTAFGLGLHGYKGPEAEANGSFLRQLFDVPPSAVPHRAFSIEPARSPFTPGHLTIGGYFNYTPVGNESTGRPAAFVEDFLYNDFEWSTSEYDGDLRRSHFKGNAVQVRAKGSDFFSEDLYTLHVGHGEKPPFVGFDSSAPLIYVSEADMKDRYMRVTNTMLKECNTSLSTMAYVSDADEGYTLPCSKAHCLPDFEFDFFPNGRTLTREVSFTVPGWATVTPTGSRSADSCRWLVGVPKNRKLVDVVDTRPYVVLGQPAFRAHRLAFHDNVIGHVYFQPLEKPESMYGVFTLAVDYEMTTLIDLDHQIIQMVVDTGVEDIKVLRSAEDVCHRGSLVCYDCSKAIHSCSGGIPKLHIDVTGYRREYVAYGNSFVTLGGSNLRTRMSLVKAVNRAVSQGGYSSFGLGWDNGDSSFFFRVLGLPLESGGQFSIYGQRDPVSRLGVLSLGGFRRPELKREGDTVKMIDHPSHWTAAKSWYIAAGVRGFIQSKTSSEPFGEVAVNYQIFAFVSSFSLIYGPQEAIEDLVELLAKYLKARKFQDYQTDDSTKGWALPTDDVKNLPDVVFGLRAITGSTAFITFTPEEYTVPSSTDCGTHRLLFGVTKQTKNDDLWIMGKPYFRTHYTEFDRSKKTIFFAPLHD